MSKTLTGGLDGLSATLARLVIGENPTTAEIRESMDALLAGDVPDYLVAAFLTALRIRGESFETLMGAVEAVRSRMIPFDSPVHPLLDTCGTGGDGTRSVNVSTAAALVVACCGVVVAKHGNRSATGNSGSSEVLEALGIPVDVPPPLVARHLERCGIGFLFAPNYHPALGSIARIRKGLPFRTVFNLLGPLVNPARPEYQLVGVSDRHAAKLMAEVLSRSGVRCAAVVSAEDGLDEVSLGAATRVYWVEPGRVEARSWIPSDFGLGPVKPDQLAVSGPEESARRIRAFLEGERGPVRDVILANASAALLVAGKASTPSEGVALASQAVDQGRAQELLEKWASSA